MHLYMHDSSSLQACYFILVNSVVPGPQSFSYFVPLLLLPLSLLVPPHVLSHNALAWVFFPVVLASVIHAWISMRGVDVISVDTLWWSLFYLVLRDPRKNFRRLRYIDSNYANQEEEHSTNMKKRIEKDTSSARESPPSSALLALDGVGLEEQPYPSKMTARCKWIFQLLTERPLTSWNINQSSHDVTVLAPHIQQSRFEFMIHIMELLLLSLLITMPLALQLAAHDPTYAHIFERSSSPLPRVVSFCRSTIPNVLLQPLTLGLYLYSLMTILFLPIFLVPTLATYLVHGGSSALWSPHTWPRPHFGPLSSVTDHGLNGLWGKWWHQQMRHAVSEPGRWLAARMQLPPRSMHRYAFICGSAFLLSGITHMGLVPPEPPGESSAWKLRLYVAGFFWAQPLGILMEVCLLEKLMVRLGLEFRSLKRILRVTWVLLFMSLALRSLLVPFVELRYWSIWPPAFLAARWKSFLRGDWIP